jgi:NAD(P)-dependent dehydrogenase (short-subunit alcohol dehydrogenase family)
MSGKTCVVTGATAGIGEVTARELSSLGANVVIVGRSPQRCKATVEAIRQQTNNAAADFLVADLSSQKEVRRVAQEVLDRCPRLDVLVNNAGAMFADRRESVDGIEMTFALNHLGYFLLTNLLLERLKASAPARIVNVSSHAHAHIKAFDIDDPQGRKHFPALSGGTAPKFGRVLCTLFAPMQHPAFVQYSQTKLANLLFTYELARRLEGTGVTVNALHPGFVATNFTAGNGVFGWFLRRYASLLAIGVEEGARTSVYLVTSPEVQGVSGRYFVKQKQVASSAASRDEAAARRLWELSEELTATPR